MRSFANRAAAILMFALALCCSACSTLQIGYNNADTLAYWWLDHYVDFNESQRPWVKRELHDLHVWHRTTQLKDYALFLAQEKKLLLQSGVDKSQLTGEYGEVKKRAWAIVERALPAMADLALSLTPEQIARIERKFADNNENFRKEYLSGDPEERQQRRYKKMRKQIEYWFGSLSREQQKQLRAMSDGRPMEYEVWMEERVQRQRNLIALLRRIQSQHPSREATEAQLKEYIATFDRDLDSGQYGASVHQAFFDNYRDATMKMIAAVVNFATPEQKAHAAQRLQKWMDDVNQLSSVR